MRIDCCFLILSAFFVYVCKQLCHKSQHSLCPHLAGTVVETLEAMDPDGDPHVGDIASYQLGTGAGDTFVINPATGVVTLAAMAKLDRDERPQYLVGWLINLSW